MYSRSPIVLFLSLISAAVHITGCAKPIADGPARSADSVDSAKAHLALEAIKPVPEFPEAAEEAPVAAEPVPQAQRFLETGKSRFDEGLWADAAASLEKALQIDPNLCEARIMLARTAMQQGDLGLARSHLEECIKVRPRDGVVYQLMGEISLQQRKYTEAISSLRLALSAQPTGPKQPERVLAHLSLALALREEGYLSAAAGQLRAFLDAIATPTPEMDKHRELHEITILYRTKAPAILGELESKLGHHDRAVDALREAVAASPDDESLQRSLILELAQAGKADEAMQRVEQLAKNDDDTPKAIELLKEICDRTNQPREFESRLLQMAERTDRISVKLKIATVLLHQNSTNQAAKVLASVVEKAPDNIDAVTLLARLRIKNGEADQAIQALTDLIREHPNQDRRVAEIVADADKNGSLKGLVAAAERAVQREPNSAISHYVHALALFASHDLNAANLECSTAIKADPEFAPAVVLDVRIELSRFNWQSALDKAKAAADGGVSLASLQLAIGEAHVALGDAVKAEGAFLEAFRLDHEDPQPLFRLAEVMERRGEMLRAEQLYRRILDDVDPRFIPAREQLVRIWLNTRKTKRAKEYFEDFDKLGQKGAAVERCRALIMLADSKSPPGRPRLDAYRLELRKIVSEFPDEAATHLALAMTYEATGDFGQARKEVDTALALDPADISCLERKADYETKLLDYETAAATLATLLKLRPNEAAYSQRLGRLALAQGDLDTAAKEFLAQLKRAETDDVRAPLVGQLVAVLKLAKRYDECIKTAKDWLDGEPTDTGRRVLYLSSLQGAHRNDEAIKTAEKWLADDPTAPDIRRMYIGQLSAAKRYVEAQQRVLGWLAADPDDVNLNDLLIRLFWQARDWDSAIEACQTGMEQPRMEDAYAGLLGRSLRLARRFEEAAELYRRLAAQPGRSIEDFPLIQTLIEAKRYQEAEKEAMSLLNRQLNERAIHDGYDPRIVLNVRQLLSRIYQLTNRPSQANQQLEEILALTPTDPGINNDLGYTWADQGIQIDRAERMIRFALGEEPLNGAYLDSLGWVFYKQGKFGDAVNYIRRAVLLAAEDDAVLHDHFADALYRLGKIDEAKEHWEKSLELTGPEENFFPSPDDEELRERLQNKLADLAAGKPVETAPLAQSESSKRPAEKEVPSEEAP